MSDFKYKLKELVECEIIPQIEDYLENLQENTINKELESIKELESFLVELYNILEVIKQNRATDFEYEKTYHKLIKQIEESDID